MTLNLNRSGLTAAFALALVAFAPLSSWAAAGDSLTVHRGASVETVTTGGAGLEVGRGEAVRTQAYRPNTGAKAVRVVAGERLWLIDGDAGRLTVCALRRTTQVGRQVIRCTTRDLPRGAF